MEGFTDAGKAVSVVLDLSLRHDESGVRILDVVKKKLVDVIRFGFEDDVDALYLYHPELIETVHNHGDQISAISNYETDGWFFRVETALKQSMYVIAGEDRDYKKYLVLITDRLINRTAIDKALFINQKDRLDCELVIVGIGDRYDRQMLENLSKDNPAIRYTHISQPSKLAEIFLKEKIDGKRNAHYSDSEFGNGPIKFRDQNICSTPSEHDQ